MGRFGRSRYARALKEEEFMAFPYVPGKQVEVPEIPYQETISLPASSTALVVVDMQNDFVQAKGNLHVEAAAATVPQIGELLEEARGKGVRIAYTQDSAVPGDPEFDIWPEHCLIGSWGWQIVEELSPKEGELICRKNRYDGFYGSWLDHFLSRVWKIEHLIIVGTVANICVLHTAASAGLRWFHVAMPADCVSALTEFDQALTLRQVSSLYAGHVCKSWRSIRLESS
jgi:nicotinamidase-related amidase